MALRVRKDGRIFCAALTEPEKGDTYIPDDLSYQLTVEHELLATYPMPKHTETGEWFWIGNAPDGVVIGRPYFTTVESEPDDAR